MKNIYIVILLFYIVQIAHSQVKQILLPKESRAEYKDGYKMNDKLFFFKDQSLVRFNLTPERALVSYFCNTSEQVYKDNVIGGDFNTCFAINYPDIDTTQSWIEPIFRLDFQYNNENYIIIRFNFFVDGRLQYTIYKRLKSEIKNGRYNYYIVQDVEDDNFKRICILLGDLELEKMRMLVGLDKPLTKQDEEVISKLVSSNGTILLNSILNLYRQGDKSVVKFFNN